MRIIQSLYFIVIIVEKSVLTEERSFCTMIVLVDQAYTHLEHRFFTCCNHTLVTRMKYADTYQWHNARTCRSLVDKFEWCGPNR
jgi:hypothetical protein